MKIGDFLYLSYKRYRSNRSALARTNFIAPGKKIIVSGHQLSGGMIYVGKLGKHPHGDTPKSYINLDAKVASSGEDIFGFSMNYWPSYSTISPQSRLAYLRWLASGRRDPEYDIGYVFLFFYGLEQRLFSDKAYEEAPAFIQEVIELRKVYGKARSFNRYSQSFLDMATLLKYTETGKINYEPMLEPHSSSWEPEIPLLLRGAIGSEITRNGVIRADLALDWWWVASRKMYPLSSVVYRVFSELRLLFHLRFDAKFPGGLKFAPPRVKIPSVYRSASRDFQSDITLDLPDICNIRAPLKKIDVIAQSCVEELRSYSRTKARSEGRDISPEALAQLPTDMYNAIPSKAADKLRVWLKQTVVGRFASVAMVDLFTETGIKFDGKLTSAKVRKVTSILNFAGYGIEPHPDFGGKYESGQNVVIFYKQGSNETQASESYLRIAHGLTLAVAIADASGEISAKEKKHLRNMVVLEGKGLSVSEQSRLTAYLEWLIAYPPAWASLRNKLKKLSLENRRSMAPFVLATALGNGCIDPDKVKLLEKLYALMEIDRRQLYTDLHAFEGALLDQPVSIRAAKPKTDYAIPQEPKPVSNRSKDSPLNMSRVEQIEQETEQTKQRLSEVFTDPGAEEATTKEKSDSFNGLDADHRLLLDKLLGREDWPREDYDLLCKELDLMAEGALETINNWAFDTYDDALIEDGDPMVIHKELLQGALTCLA